MLRELAQARAQQHPAWRAGLTASQLAEGMRIDPLQTEPILGSSSRAMDWIGRLEEASSADARYLFVLLRDPMACTRRCAPARGRMGS